MRDPAQVLPRRAQQFQSDKLLKQCTEHTGGLTRPLIGGGAAHAEIEKQVTGRLGELLPRAAFGHRLDALGNQAVFQDFVVARHGGVGHPELLGDAAKMTDVAGFERGQLQEPPKRPQIPHQRLRPHFFLQVQCRVGPQIFFARRSVPGQRDARQAAIDDGLLHRGRNALGQRQRVQSQRHEATRQQIDAGAPPKLARRRARENEPGQTPVNQVLDHVHQFRHALYFIEGDQRLTSPRAPGQRLELRAQQLRRPLVTLPDLRPEEVQQQVGLQ